VKISQKVLGEEDYFFDSHCRLTSAWLPG